MSEPRFDIFFRGECLPQFQPEQVKQQFAALFKTSPEKTQQLFSGENIVLKKALDREATLKFKQLLEKTGAKVYIRNSAENSSIPAAPSSSKPTVTTPTSAPTTAPAPHSDTPSGLEILPVGSDVLTTNERQHVTAIAPDISHLSTAALGADLLEGFHQKPIAAAPDTSRISLAEAGGTIPTLKHEQEIIIPDIAHIDLAEVGADLDTTTKSPTPTAPDTSHIKLI